ncbi:MAG: pkn [Planctomycetota bacterium]|nr:pkn [Planctomycetota bacterium]
MPLDPRRVKGLFNAALDLPDGDDRSAFLDRECGDDRELRRRLVELLAADDHPASVLERPLAVEPEPVPATAPDDRTAASEPRFLDEEPTVSISDPTATFSTEPGSQLVGSLVADRYKIRQQIGEGGMGSVYLAEQIQPVKRQVALKLIKAGMDSRTVLARFESERQALALMDHPNIATVLDAGATERGRPFFVMELVKGVPLTEYCDRHQLGLPERLGLFRQICSAVQHAHQKGIIHRDLKPSNILVESHDGRPVPKVIDFGLAKATGGLQLSEHSLHSAFGSVAGTPLYMAPEQASFNAIDVDTRADIYALGVILYELLTGSTPIRRETFQRAALDEMLRNIREIEPPTPSSRIGSSDTLPNIAANRHTEPARLSRFVRGDLDWIVMKALAKERHRRYESAIAFAQDVERFESHEPVSAGPPTATYRFKKYVRRNRGQVIAAALVLASLVGGIVGTTLGLFEANRQKGFAIAQEKETKKRLTQKDKANEILLSVFRDLNPRGGDRESLPLSARLGRRLDLAMSELEGEATDNPLSVARMQLVLGESQLGLGYAAKAIALATKARATMTARLGPEHPDTLISMNNLADGYLIARKLDRALPLYQETLNLRTAKLGPNHSETLVTMAGLADAYRVAGKLDLAVPLLEKSMVLTRATFGPDHQNTLTSMINLANGYQDAGKLDLALPLNLETLALRTAKFGPDHLDTFVSMNDLARSYLAAGQADRARALQQETLAMTKAKLGPDHPLTITTMNNLAEGYRAAGTLDLALPLYIEALALAKVKHGADHPETLTLMNNLAIGYMSAGRVDLSVPLHEETLALRKARLGIDHPETLSSMNNLSLAYVAAGKLDRALPLLEEALALARASLGLDHPITLSTQGNLAEGYRTGGKMDRALPLAEETLTLTKAKYGPDHPDTLTSMSNLALAFVGANKLDLAQPLLEEALAREKPRLGIDHPLTLTTMGNLAAVYRMTGKLDQSIPLIKEALRLRIEKSGTDHPDTWFARANLGMNYLDAGRMKDALPLLEGAHVASRKYPTLRVVAPLLLDAYVRAGQSEKAATLARQLLAESRPTVPAGSLQLAGLLAQASMILLEVKAWDEVEPLVRECLAIREKAEPDAWTTFNTKSILGAVLLGQKKYTDAEPFLRDGYEGMKKQADKIPPQGKIRLGEGLDRLIALAEATNKPDDAKAWKAEKSRLPGVPATKPASAKK